jgi:hypothetical protein
LSLLRASMLFLSPLYLRIIRLRHAWVASAQRTPKTDRRSF